MAESQVQVFMPKEKADELKAKYNLTDESLQEVMGNLKVTGTPESKEEAEEEQEEPEIFSRIGKGETSIGDAMVLIDFYDRREARKLQRPTNTTPEMIAKAVADGIKEAFPAKPKTEDEMPPWAKELQDDMKEIKNREQKKEEEARLQATVQTAIKPIQEELGRTKDELTKTKETLEPKKPEKGELETTRETLKNLKEIDELRGKGESTQGKPKELIIDLNEEVANALGDEIKNTIVSAVKEKLSGEGTPAVTTTPDGKVQVEWYKLGKDILNTVNRFIEKLPTTAPPKKPVTEMPPPGKPLQLPTPPPTTTPRPPPPPTPTPQPAQTPIAPPTPPAETTSTAPPPTSTTTAVQVTSPPQPEVATATLQEEKPTPPERKAIEETKSTEEPKLQEEKPEEAPKTEEKPQKSSKKNEEQKEEAEKTEKAIIVESTTKESVVEQETSGSGGSEETPHGGSVTEKGRRKPTESD